MVLTGSFSNMKETLQTLSIILPIVAFLSVLLVLGVNFYLVIRRRFLVRVNCWFCNEWLKVPYDNKNSFDCTSCLQYNGFDANGDYNKVIHEQHDISKVEDFMKQNASNGLCKLCNNNLQLKIYQLANFVPLNEDNYDLEIEHFQKQLEKAYELCKNCNVTLKKTLQSQSRWLLGLKFSKIRKNGLKLLDLNTSSNGISKEKKQSVFFKSLQIMKISFAVLLLANIFISIDYSNKNLHKHVPQLCLPTVMFLKRNILKLAVTVRSLYETSLQYAGANEILIDDINHFKSQYFNFILNSEHFNGLLAFVPDIIKNVTVPEILVPSKPMSNITSVSLVGFFMQLVLMTKSRENVWLQFVLWGIIVAINLAEYINFYSTMIQIVAILVMLYSSIIKKKKQRRITKMKASKLVDLNADVSTAEHFDTFENDINHSLMNSSFYSTAPDKIAYSSSERSFHGGSPRSMKSEFSAYKTGNDHVFGQTAMINRPLTSFSEISTRSDLNRSFITANMQSDTASVFGRSYTSKSPLDADLHSSFFKLNLGQRQQTHNNLYKVQKKAPSLFSVNANIARPRPILSPAKLNFNSKLGKKEDYLLLDTNLSRSSSQSSGFVSQSPTPEDQFFSLPASRNNSLYGDVDRISHMSEPIYQYINKENNNRSMHNYFYPIATANATNYRTVYQQPLINLPDYNNRSPQQFNMQKARCKEHFL